MKKSDSIMGLLFAAVGLAFLIPSLKMGAGFVGADGVPGAGFFPALLSALMIIFGLVISVSGFRCKEKNDFLAMDDEQKENIKPLIVTPLALLGFFAIWRFTFFELGMLCFCLFINWIYGRTLKFNITFSIGFVVLVHLIFVLGLKIQFGM